jgi:hypothetical protein
MKIATHSGSFVDLANLDPSSIKIEDIDHSLDQLVRFAGHTTEPITVSGHCVRTAQLLESWGFGVSVQLAGLCHDIPEYLIQDIPGPFKHSLLVEVEGLVLPIAEFEAGLARQILAALGLPYLDIEHPAVRFADAVALYWEALLWLPGQGHWNTRPANRVIDGRMIDPGLVTEREINPRSSWLDLYRVLESKYRSLS